MWTNPVVKWTTIGGMFRFFETFSHVYWMPSFIQQVYPAYKSQFGLYYAAIVAGGGFIATIMGGLISDKYEKKNRMTKALVCLVGGIIAMPALSACVLTTNNFWLSMTALAIKYLASENWMSPAITMMQATVEPKKQGSIVTAHLFYLTAIGCFSAVSLGVIANWFNAVANPAIYGKLIFGFSMIGYIGAIPSFWRAGKQYKKFVESGSAEAATA